MGSGFRRHPRYQSKITHLRNHILIWHGGVKGNGLPEEQCSSWQSLGIKIGNSIRFFQRPFHHIKKIWLPLLSYEAGMKRGFLKTWTFFLDVNSSSLLDEMSVGLSSRSGLRAMESFSKVPPPGENHFGCSYCLYRLVIFSEDKNKFSCRLPEVSQAFSQAPPIGMSDCFFMQQVAG